MDNTDNPYKIEKNDEAGKPDNAYKVNPDKLNKPELRV